jgi:hypothetical protein
MQPTRSRTVYPVTQLRPLCLSSNDSVPLRVIGLGLRDDRQRGMGEVARRKSSSRTSNLYSTQEQKQSRMHLSTTPAPVAPKPVAKTSQPSATTPPTSSVSKKRIQRTVHRPNHQPPCQSSGKNANLDMRNVLCPGDCRVDPRRNVSETDERFDNQEEPGGEK